MRGVEDDIITWVAAFVVWLFVWFRVSRKYDSKALPLAVAIRRNSIANMAECLVLIGLYIAVWQGYNPHAWILYLLPAFVILQAFLVDRSGSWMRDPAQRQRLRKYLEEHPE